MAHALPKLPGVAFRAALLGLVLAGCAEREISLPGQRLDIFGRPLAGQVNLAAPIELPAIVNISDWPQRAARADHVLPHAALADEPKAAWLAGIGQGNTRRHRITADPVSDGAHVFVMDSRALVSAVTPDGATTWQRDLGRASDNSEDASGGGLAVAGGRLFAATGFSELSALDAATGEVLWQQRFDAPVAGAPALSGGKVYVATRDSNGWVLDASNGRLLWQVQGAPAPIGVSGGAGPSVGPTYAIFPFASGQVTAVYRAQGFPAWRNTLAGGRLGHARTDLNDVASGPVIGGGRVYAGTPSGRIFALDRQSGERVWVAETGATGPLLLAGGSVFAISDASSLVRLSARDGRRIWSADLPQFKPVALFRKPRDIFPHFGPILAGGRVWVASGDGALRAFDPVDGRQVKELALGAGAATRPIVVNRTLYVVTDDGLLRAFR